MNGGGQIYEIQPANEPTINVSKYYPKLTEYRVECGYDLVKITYATTSVQRLYKIDDGEWKIYTGGNVRLETGETIYAKGMDKNGEETRTISSYTSVLPSDALGVAAYDDNMSTSASGTYLEIDESMIGKSVYVKAYRTYIYGQKADGTKALLKNGEANIEGTFTIPTNVKGLTLTGYYQGAPKIYEIRPAN